MTDVPNIDKPTEPAGLPALPFGLTLRFAEPSNLFHSLPPRDPWAVIETAFELAAGAEIGPIIVNERGRLVVGGIAVEAANLASMTQVPILDMGELEVKQLFLVRKIVSQFAVLGDWTWQDFAAAVEVELREMFPVDLFSEEEFVEASRAR